MRSTRPILAVLALLLGVPAAAQQDSKDRAAEILKRI
jgi:hypothetical protein